MLDVFHIAKPQNCDIQMFYGSGTTASASRRSWSKPRGVSNIYMLLIGAGGSGDGASGGGSGAVTVWYGSAQNVPDVLDIRVGFSVQASQIFGQFSSSIALLTANAGVTGGGGGPASTANQFAASGFYQSIAGQAGSATTVTASTTTFLSGGSSSTTSTYNYGYQNPNETNGRGGYFLMQPIIVGVGSANQNNTGALGDIAGIGCGGGKGTASQGGPGMVLIASW